jgi:hypothetical protein
MISVEVGAKLGYMLDQKRQPQSTGEIIVKPECLAQSENELNQPASDQRG